MALLATAFTYVLSLSDVIDPPHWIRILGLVWLPIGFIAAAVTYAVARLGPGRRRGRIGLALPLAGLAVFVVRLWIAG